jgi:hypothetical protein
MNQSVSVSKGQTAGENTDNVTVGAAVGTTPAVVVTEKKGSSCCTIF